MTTEKNVRESTVSDEEWKAVSENDKAYDGCFFYAVKTTRIFCRPSCKSRLPKKENVAIFRSAEDALDAGYRPCKRCRPAGDIVPNDEWTQQIKDYIDANYRENLTLNKISEECHGSPFHLHRTFKKISGMTPLDYLLRVRIDKAIWHLRHSDKSVIEIGRLVGIGNPAQFATTFKENLPIGKPLGEDRGLVALIL
ncbi:bifunctional transcriptional activator/DNA repair enzyme AdaA [Sporolactobacillus pectinivorans]|uniref:bifunctional transcriptional activator/DNA repair enzyme AdaA n=1 Tax=Sporolactobacillus pectinivorans TaxID=1591408 RepID=UPI000C25EC09|nr:bifunctional transcriptional activator/DNA repair enzyme AdaA [Sporolactobacillus pectinivorans]